MEQQRTLYVEFNRSIQTFQTFNEEEIKAKSKDWLNIIFPEPIGGAITREIIGETKEKMGKFLEEYMLEHYYTQNEVAKAQLDGAIEPLLLTCVDVATDLIVAILLIKRGRHIVGGALLSTFFVTNLANALVGHFVQRDAVATIMALMGFKPIYDLYISTGYKATRQIVRTVEEIWSDTLNPDSVILFTHMIEAILESIPAGFVQFSLIVSERKQQSLFNAISLISSMVTTGYLLATVSRDFDTDARYQSQHSHMHGYIPRDPFGHLMTVTGHIMFITGMCASRTVAIGVLSTSSTLVFLVWIFAEMLIFGFIRKYDRNFLFFGSRFANLPVSCLLHFMWYWLGTCAAPSIMRDGHILGPHFYMIIVVYTCVVSNPAMTVVGLYAPIANHRIFEVERNHILGILLVVEGITVVGAILMLTYMKPQYRKTFYEYLPYRDYLKLYWWRHTVHSRLGDGHDAARATVILMDAAYYWNKKQVYDWLQADWSRLKEERPDWMKREWKKRLFHGLEFLANCESNEGSGTQNESDRTVVQLLQRLRDEDNGCGAVDEETKSCG